MQREIDFFWGHHWFWQGQNTRSFELFNRALAWIPNSSFGVRGHAFLFWGLASQMLDRKHEAVRAFNEWLYSEQTSHPLRRIRPLGSLIFIHRLSGELAEAVQVTQQMQGIAENYANTYIRAWAFYLMGQICFYRNDLETAVHNFSQTVELRYNLHARAAIDSLAGLTLTYHTLEQSDRSRATMALLLEIVQLTSLET